MSERMQDQQYMQQTAEETSTQHELDIIKSEMHERSRSAGTIEIIGTLGGEKPSEYWTGGISLAARLESGELTDAEVKESLDFLSGCFVPTQKGASVGCIDGRLVDGYDDTDPAWFGRTLGPKSPGGTAVDAIADRVALGAQGEPFETVHLRSDIDTMADVAVTTGYKPGDHVADNCAEGKCGCGAVDGVEQHCETVNLPARDEVMNTVRSLLGEDFDDTIFAEVAGSVAQLLSVKDNYMLAKQEIIAELVARNPDAAPVMVDSHNEIICVLQMVQNETLHTDHYAARTGGKIQAFNYDVWHTLDVAQARYPEDTKQQSRFIHARFALAITALMGLTDGTLLLATRTAHDFKLES